MVPMWPRVRRFSNLYAFATLDVLAVVFWLSAWAAMASYVGEGKGKGDNEDEDASGCDNFKFGSPARCRISEGITAIGVIIMLAFIGTAYLSFQAVMRYRQTGEMPSPPVGNDNLAKQTQDAFSSSMRNDDPFEDHQDHLDPRQGGASGYGPARVSDEDEYAPLQNNEPDFSQVPPTQPAGPLSYNTSSPAMQDYETSYSGAYGKHTADDDYNPGGYNR